MPTARPRHTITETDEISRTLEAAAQRAVTTSTEQASKDRRTAIVDMGGALTGSFPDGYREQLRDDWRE